ncbi:hypothetical protein BKA57DRAFT_141287 [Linnemannia elongata]|nr:hypothetical protein BKA57DRAFT_141287 [Linnemannia elongata]
MIKPHGQHREGWLYRLLLQDPVPPCRLLPFPPSPYALVSYPLLPEHPIFFSLVFVHSFTLQPFKLTVFSYLSPRKRRFDPVLPYIIRLFFSCIQQSYYATTLPPLSTAQLRDEHREIYALLTLTSATKCFCLRNNGGDTPLGLNRLACQRAGHDFHEDGCYVATTNGCAVPPQGPEINQMIDACKFLEGDWTNGYLNCNC